ncbi:MAG: PIN domain-containing protein [Bryobacteraceae bacterium]
MTYLLDTNILIGILTGRKPYADMLAKLVRDHNVLATCAVVVSEIYAGMRPAEAQRTNSLLASLLYLQADFEVARRAGLIRADAITEGRHMALADASIAATAMEHGCTLITENGKDFHVPGLRMEAPAEARAA